MSSGRSWSYTCYLGTETFNVTLCLRSRLYQSYHRITKPDLRDPEHNITCFTYLSHETDGRGLGSALRSKLGNFSALGL